MHRRRRTIGPSATALALLLIVAGVWFGSPSVTTATTDATPPTVVSPVVRFRPLVTFGRYAQMSITIIGYDAGSGMNGKPQWAVSRNGGPFVRFTPVSSTVTWSGITDGIPHRAAVVIYRTFVMDGTYRFAGRMFDRAGNASRWVYGPTLSPRIIEDSATNIVYSPGWVDVSDGGFSGGAAHETGAAGETATLRVSARAFAWVARQGADKGQAEIRIDGVLVTTVDLYRLEPLASKTTMFTKTWNMTGLHTIQITVVGTPGHPLVDIDAVLILR